jgi:hypothetical protein
MQEIHTKLGSCGCLEIVEVWDYDEESDENGSDALMLPRHPQSSVRISAVSMQQCAI